MYGPTTCRSAEDLPQSVLVHKGRAAHLQDRGYAVGCVQHEVVPFLDVRVHVGEPGEQILRTAAVDLRRIARHVHFTHSADRNDRVAFDDDGLMAQHSLRIHRQHVDVDERRKRRRETCNKREHRAWELASAGQGSF